MMYECKTQAEPAEIGMRVMDRLRTGIGSEASVLYATRYGVVLMTGELQAVNDFDRIIVGGHPIPFVGLDSAIISILISGKKEYETKLIPERYGPVSHLELYGNNGYVERIFGGGVAARQRYEAIVGEESEFLRGRRQKEKTARDGLHNSD
jgi:hypothetical protein